jgi:multiple sugar transport system permease protein
VRATGRYVLLAALGVLFLTPVVLGLKDVAAFPYGRAFINSVVIAACFTALSTASSALAGFAFARNRVWWKNALFVLVLGTLMVPWVVTLLPQSVLFYRLHLVGTYWPWVLWGLQGTPLQIFLFRQFYAGFPRELEEAAALDGSSRLRIFWDLFVPNSKPVVAVAAVWAFIFVWGDYLTQDLFYLSNANGTLLTRLTDQLAAGGNPGIYGLPIALYALPPIVFFIAVQRHIVRGVVTTGLKG